MNARSVTALIAATVLSVIPASAKAGDVELVYAYGGSFDLRIPADLDASKGWMKDAGFTSARTEPLVGPDSMVIGIK